MTFKKCCCVVLLSLVSLCVTLTSDVSCPGAPLSPPLSEFVYEFTGAAAGRVTLNRARGRSAVVGPDRSMETSGDLPVSRDLTEPQRPLGAGVSRYCGVTYTRAALLQLRGAAVVSPPDPVVALLRRLGLCRRRHRGVRAGRKSRRPITVIVTTRHGHRRAAEVEGGCSECRLFPRPPAPSRHLLLPARLTLRQTRQAVACAERTASQTLRVGHLNVRSLTSHMDDVGHLIGTERLDLLCLSETFLTASVDSCMLVIPGYAICRRDRATGRSGGGVAVLYRNTLTVERLRAPAPQSALEALWLQVTGRSSIIIGTVYRPPSCPAAAALDDLHRQLRC